MRLGIAFLALVVSTPAAAADWSKIFWGGSQVFYIDLNSIKKLGPMQVQAWWKTEDSSPTSDIRKVVFQSTVDCAARKHKVDAALTTYKDGSTVTQQDAGLWRPIYPDTFVETAWETFCTDKPPTGFGHE